MAKILSQEEIDALLNSVSTGEEVVNGGLKARKKVTVYDFKHPNLISKEQMRFLENIHEGLARNFSVFLSAQLRMIVDMNLLAIDQIMYSEFVMSIAPPSAIYVGNFDDPYSQFVLEINTQLVIFIVEKLFGGKGSFISNNRPISQIEQKIMRRVVDKVAIEISKNWKPIKDFACEFTRFESNPEFVQIIPSSEPVVVVTMEIQIHGNTTMMNFCYPYMWISNIMSIPEVQGKILFGAQEATEEEQDLVKLNLKSSSIDIRAILGRSKIPIKDSINMKLGDVIRLDSEVGSKRPAFVQNKYLYDTTIGRRGKNYAFQINSVKKGDQFNEL
ncbi:MAG: flagellar motor switch protein FliM [Calditrichaeota bacterium]|jgi:flagellar motor switch protein FliM|nr:flagellar motor switch protein FliM [Calditrichota bacterium]